MSNAMFCPRCGKRFIEKTSYCRTCGLSLDGVREIVGGEAADAPEKITKPNFTAIRIGIGLFIFGTVLGLAHTVLRDLDLFPEIYGKIVFMIFIIAGLFTLGTAFLFPTTTYKKRNLSHSLSGTDSTNPLDPVSSATALPPSNLQDAGVRFPKDAREPVSVEPGSVTEQTTRRLE